MLAIFFLAGGVELALENLSDGRYADHLAGVNRVSGSDVPVGVRIAGAGRSVAVSVNYEF
jgi:iron complex outermembrane receptor protein